MSTDVRTAWLVATVITGWLVYLLAPVLTPFVASALLAYIGDPLADRLEKLRFPRTLAVVTVFLLTFMFIGLLVLLVGPLVQQQVSALFSALPAIAANVEEVLLPNVVDLLGIEPGDSIGIGAFLSDYKDMAGNWAGKILQIGGTTGSMLAAAVMSLFLIPILTFYLLRDWDGIIVRLGALVPASQRDTVFSLAKETDEVLGAFLRGQIMVMLALSVLYSVGLSFFGLQYAIAIGVVSGLVSFVPYLGLVFGIALASLTVVFEPNPWIPLAGIVGTFTVAQFLEGTVLTPKLVGDQIGLHPVVVIFAIAAGGQLFGFFGVLLALPAAAVLSVLVRFAFNRYLREHPEVEATVDGDG